MNMPARDPYDTQNAIALLRQHRDYEHWYDKSKLTVKDIKNTQLMAAMNPTAGSFIVNPRLQRHFWLLAVGFPEQSSLSTIYSAYLNKHFSKFKGTIQAEIGPVIKATLALHSEVERNFRKTAANFHYEFNVRHLTNVFQGLLTAKQEAIKEPDNFIKLWVHESERIYGDRLVNPAHLAQFRTMTAELAAKSFSKFNLKKYFGPTPEPLMFANFVASLDDKLYDQFPSAASLSKRLQEALREYNDTNAVMDLVLFEDAMKHVCKISRIISAESGHALLVGVGGSGKQSLSRLSSFICQYATVQIMISSTYGMNDLKADLQKFYMRSGVKDEGLMFLFTEGQITNERFMVFLNDLLSSGEIADLFPAEDIDTIVNNIRPAVKGEGILDSKDNCWKFFIDRVKRNLHMALCFSPGESLRGRAKKFPALINCSVIDWFHPWPEDALLSVATKFLEEIEMDTPEIREGIQKFMPYSFKSVNEYSEQILIQERRYVYTTPKSFLELIKLFKVMFKAKEGELQDNKDKYETGVIKLTETGEIVSKLEEELKIFSVEVEAKKKSADEQAEVVGGEKVKVEAQNAIAEDEAQKCAAIKKSV
jgi:dynein heavy chain